MRKTFWDKTFEEGLHDALTNIQNGKYRQLYELHVGTKS